MATSEENNLIGYDPLAWMEDDTDKNAESIDQEITDSDNTQERSTFDNEIGLVDDYSDQTIGNTEDELINDGLKGDSALIEDFVDCMDAGDIAPKVGAKTDEEAIIEASIEESQIDLDATLTIQNVVKLHERLKNALAFHDAIEINASDVSSIDTATLQLLVSLKKDAVKLQKTVTIIYPSPRFVESAQLLGLLDVLDVQS
jgi:anti-anti-sigma regulatory factor